MHKTLALFTAIFLIILSLYIGVFATVNKEKENVIVRENYIFGDKKHTEKVDINFKAQYYDNLLWDISYDISENKADTEFSLYRNRIPYTSAERNEFTLSGGFWDHTTIGFADDDEYAFTQAYKELTENATPYEEVKKVISVSDYSDYYPVSVEVFFTDKFHVDTSSYINTNEEHYLIKGIRDFFKIPVLKNHLMTITATVNESGNIFQSGSSSLASDDEDSIYDEFGLYAESVITEDKCLIYFSNKTYKGKYADTNEIPGGYGIYCLPYSYSENGSKVSFDVDKLSNVFPVDENHTVTELKLSKDEKYVYMITEENRECYLTVIDSENFDALQKFKVSTYEDQSAGFGYIEEDFAVINHYHEHLKPHFTLYILDENGLFQKKFTALTHIENKVDDSGDIRYPGADIYQDSTADVEWDGEKLYVTNIYEDSYSESISRKTGFSLSVYNKDGLQFFGNYNTSLSTGNDGMYASSYNVRLSHNDKIDITLK